MGEKWGKMGKKWVKNEITGLQKTVLMHASAHLEPATIPFHSAKWPSASLPSTLSRKNSYLTYARA